MKFVAALSWAAAGIVVLMGPARADNDVSGAVRRLWERHEAVVRYELQLQDLARRELAGENVTVLRTGLWMKRPTYAGLEQDALRIIEADPGDKAAFVAIQVVLDSQLTRLTLRNREHWNGSSEAQLNASLGNILLQYHLGRPELYGSRVLNRVQLIDARAAIDFWKRVYESAPDAPLRGEAAGRLLRVSFERFNALDVPPPERDRLRQEIERYAGVIRRDYAGDAELNRCAAEVISGLAASVGVRLSNVQARTVEGKADALENYSGKVLLLDFWFVKCGWCITAHPSLIEFRREMAGRPFEIIAISVDEDPAEVIQYMKKKGALPWVNWNVGAESELTASWGVTGFPTYLLVDADGVVRQRTHYFDADAKASARAWVDRAEEAAAIARGGILPSISNRAPRND